MNSPIRRFAGSVGVLVILLASTLSGEIRRVPQEYASIQAALDVVADDDTVLVSLGTYAEELMAPPHRFWLIGDVEIDTGNFARPVIDPSTLDSARWRKCLTIPDGCQLDVERMAFVNRAPMYPRSGWNSGGIFVHTVQPTTFRYCSFDSVYRAIVDAIDTLPPPPRRVRYTIEDCRFTNAPRIQVRASESGSMAIRRSYFHGHRCTSWLVLGGDSSWVEDCVFEGDSVAGALYLYGENLVVQNCVLGPIDTCTYPVINLRNLGPAVIGNNIVHDILMRNTLTVDLQVQQRLGYADSATIFFHHNYLMNIVGSGLNGRTGVGVWRSGNSPTGISAQVDSNVFVNNVQALSSLSKALGTSTRATLTGNRFMNLLPTSNASVGFSTDPLDPEPGFQLRYNQFEAQDYAVHSFYVEADAIFNYWGDPSGPYNALHNPEGQGARVDDLVLFDPWSPDTNFLSVPGLGRPLPEEFMFEAYPNPFNSTVTLNLIPPEVMIVRVELFDVLGRKVKDIWKGPLAFRKQITFDGSQLSSGIYFARVTDVIDRNTLVTAKLVLLK